MLKSGKSVSDAAIQRFLAKQQLQKQRLENKKKQEMQHLLEKRIEKQGGKLTKKLVKQFRLKDLHDTKEKGLKESIMGVNNNGNDGLRCSDKKSLKFNSRDSLLQSKNALHNNNDEPQKKKIKLASQKSTNESFSFQQLMNIAAKVNETSPMEYVAEMQKSSKITKYSKECNKKRDVVNCDLKCTKLKKLPNKTVLLHADDSDSVKVPGDRSVKSSQVKKIVSTAKLPCKLKSSDFNLKSELCISPLPTKSKLPCQAMNSTLSHSSNKESEVKKNISDNMPMSRKQVYNLTDNVRPKAHVNAVNKCSNSLQPVCKLKSKAIPIVKQSTTKEKNQKCSLRTNSEKHIASNRFTNDNRMNLKSKINSTGKNTVCNVPNVRTGKLSEKINTKAFIPQSPMNASQKAISKPKAFFNYDKVLHPVPAVLTINRCASNTTKEDTDEGDYESDDSMKDFIDDSGFVAADNEVTETIRKVFNYDKRKYVHERDDDDLRSMEASYRDIVKEEAQSTRAGLLEDLKEFKKSKGKNAVGSW